MKDVGASPVSPLEPVRPPGRAVGWRSWLLLLVLLIPALLLRLPIAEHDLEHYIGPDEGEVVENVIEMMKTGDWNHRHPGYPGLHFYLLRGVFSARMGWAGWQGQPAAIPEMSRDVFYRTARRVSVFASWLSALFVFALVSRGSLLEGARVSAAMFAAFLVAYSPLVFRESQVTNPDLTLMMFVSLSLLVLTWASERPSRFRWFIVGLSCAAATAIKYTGAVVLLPAVVGVFLSSADVERERLAACMRALFAVGLGFALGFVAVSPYTFVHLGLASEGFDKHLSYYQLARRNAAVELLRQTWWQGLGPGGAVFAGLGVVLVMLGRGRSLGKGRFPGRSALLVALVPMGVLLVFSFFTRAFPRHALILIVPSAALAGWSWSYLTESRFFLRWGAAVLVGGVTLSGCLPWSRAALVPTAAARAYDWAVATLPEDARILQDQFTPRLAPLFSAQRLRVEEKVFVGAFDWVFFSGYPPGIKTESLRPIAQFETNGALGSPVSVFQVPDRASLMGVTLTEDRAEAGFGAGELPFFGSGWSEPESGAFATSRVSMGRQVEVYFVMPATRSRSDEAAIEIQWEASVVVTADDSPITAGVFLNGELLATEQLVGERPVSHVLAVEPGGWVAGLNTLEWRFNTTRRQNRRRPETAIRLYRVGLKWKDLD